MNNKVNYTLIGFITLIGFALVMSFGYWLLKPTAQADTKRYHIYFNESILGLNVDAPVKYKGITVGKVSALQIDPNNSEQVEVTIDIITSTPVKTTTLARLTAQGITGLSYINLSMGENDSPLLEPLEENEYAIIKTEPSFFENIEKSLSDVSIQLSNTLQKTELLLDDDNQLEVSRILQKTANVLDKLDRTLDDKTIKHMQNTMANLDGITKKLNIAMPNLELFVEKGIEWEENTSAALESIMKSYLGIQGTMAEIENAVISGDFNLKEITSDVVPALTNTLLEFQNLMIGLEDMLDNHRRSPSDILYKKEIIKKAPGEK